MKTIEIFEVTYYGGTEGRTHCTDKYETYEQAVKAAKADTWNDYNTITKVVMTFNGKITEEKTPIETIKTAGYYKRAEMRYNCYVNEYNKTDWNTEIENVKNNKRMKNENKEKKIAEIIRQKEMYEKNIEKYAEIIAENK